LILCIVFVSIIAALIFISSFCLLTWGMICLCFARSLR
jgi:hypothetical protein